MKRKMKNWIFISMLFVGISLTVYAVAPEVIIRSITVANVTSTTADVIVEHKGVVSLLFEVSTPDGNVIATHFQYPGTNSPDDEFYSGYFISGLTPNTIYNVKVTAKGYPGIDVDAGETFQISAFITAAE